MKNKPIIASVTVSFAVALLAVSTIFTGLPASGETVPNVDDVKITEFKWYDRDFFVPKIYERLPFLKGDTSMAFHVMHPDFTPLLISTRKLWKQKDRYFNYVRILVNKSNPRDGMTVSEALAKSSEHFNATEFVSEEYGLKHYTQPEEGNQDTKDLWVEGSKENMRSRVTCSEKLTANSTPYCHHYFVHDTGFFKVSYDKRILSDWKNIQENTIALYDSFSSKESAQAYLKTKLDILK